MHFPYTWADLPAIGFLIFLEGVLSIDNALVLALIVGGLPKEQRRRALTYGIVGAIVFRIIAIGLATYLMHWQWVKFVGGAYLLYLAIEYWWGKEEKKGEHKHAEPRGFWTTVFVVELTDIAFAVDSILTAVALTKKVSVVIAGGILGLVLMRYAASVFVRLLEKYPRFEPTAYLLVFLIGIKLIVDGFHLPAVDFHSMRNPFFWVFWGAMAAAFLYGFSGQKSDRS